MYQRSLFIPISIILSTLSFFSSAHIEHDKARYVAENGIDKGHCDKPFRACKTISYAVQQASKGDKVLVASGHYKLESESDIFYLQSQLVPVKAGFNRMDHFQVQSPVNNPTFISNAPSTMHDALYKAGFTIVNDGKSNLNSSELKVKLAKVKQLSHKQSNETCQNGTAAGFECKNVDLLAHIPLNSFSGNPASGSDIWGHIDLNTHIEYALMAHSDGVTVFDLSEPTQPKEVGTINGVNTTWRDVKVYQYFDKVQNSYQAYAYVTAESSDGVVIVDLNNLPHSISQLNDVTAREQSIHNVYISNIDYGLNLPLPQSDANVIIVGGSKTGGAFRSYSLENPKNIPLTFQNTQATRADYTHDAASAFIKDTRAQRDCGETSGKCTVLVDFNENEMRVWNISNSENAKLLSSISYSEVSDDNKYVHSGWFSEDNRYVFVHDEFDETRGELNTTVRVFDLQDLTSPIQVASWKGNNQTIDHNGFARGNRYYMSNYERGLTILDISEPTDPKEIGYFDTFPSSNNSSYSGAWGVYPFLPSGIILLSDINSGLYILKDNSKKEAKDRLSFTTHELVFDKTGLAKIPVNRSGDTNLATSIEYETLNGSADETSDFTYKTGTLNWQAGDNETKFISLDITKIFDGTKPHNNFFIRLFNSQSQSAIGEHGYITINLQGIASVGNISLEKNAIRIAENQGSIEIPISRLGGSRGRLDLNVDLSNTSLNSQDFSVNHTQLMWQNGETAQKILTINLIDDDISEQDEVINILISTTDEDGKEQKNQLTITLLDDENNLPPEISLSQGFDIAPRGTYSGVTTLVSDPEGDDVTFLWQQISGSPIEFVDPTNSLMSIIVGDISGEIELQLTATDQRGASASANVTMTVVVPEMPAHTSSNSSGGTLYWLTLLLMAFIKRRKI
ncbi:choice-of-anchor B family protein [Pseudoalteromonas denitrificans]|uniref:Choice-of-anchor B domain-containing protein n=1 Tax=Pseudoalteromonas denitrificans DSM 6059 TaxID=1123010 RepID=A0A1I1DT36_9GAMM|nr:choice-of-anchor B family protein [Pseudoalteromonas denitrificans]SFB77556.1 choice-of-anchor B domain-containing protein [Pseudoalteromonas denitrificans DSM 6059]